MTPLAKLLNLAKGDRSVDTLIADARKRGVPVPESARGNIYKALDGKHAKTPTDRVLTLWAEVFRLNVQDLREAVGRPRGELGPWVPPDEANQLNEEQREALGALIKAIVRGGGEGEQTPAIDETGDGDDGGSGATVTDLHPDGPPKADDHDDEEGLAAYDPEPDEPGPGDPDDPDPT